MRGSLIVISSASVLENDYRILDCRRRREKQIDETLAACDSGKTPGAKTTWRNGDGSAAFYNYIYSTLAEFPEHDTLHGNHICKADLTREEALTMAEEEHQTRYSKIKWHIDAMSIDFNEAIEVVHAIRQIY